MISAIRDGRNETFRNMYRSVDILLVDDIQFIAGKETHAGRVLPHVQHAAQREQADCAVLG